MIEEWKDVPNFEGIYQISNQGNIRRCLKNGYKIRKPYKTPRGYLLFDFYNKPLKVSRLQVHRIVAELFVENPNNYQEVDHIDRNPSNNSANNLRWVTHSQNMRNVEYNTLLTINGETKTLSEWAEISHISYDTIKQRKNKLGWSDYDCVFKPLRSEIYRK